MGAFFLKQGRYGERCFVFGRLAIFTPVYIIPNLLPEAPMYRITKSFLSFILLFPFILPASSAALISPQKVYITGSEYFFEWRSAQQDSTATLTLSLDKHKLSIAGHKTGADHLKSETVVFPASGAWRLQSGGQPLGVVRVIPGWLSILPPLIAIVLALIFRQVLVALFAGVFTGALILHGYNPLSGFLYAASEYIGHAAANPDNFAIIVFSLTLGGMVGVISRAGGTQGIVEALSRYASGYRRGQLATWAMGILIFFDDYANTLIVGNTMRPFTDKLKISREKLAYLVDSTAAPITTIALISTWIGYQISLIGQAYGQLGLNANAYLVFLKTIPYSFYPILALVFAFFIGLLGRDFGPMLRAERRAQHQNKILADNAVPLADMDAQELLATPDTPLRWYNALIPILTVILTTIIGLWVTGYETTGPKSAADTWVHYISSVFGAGDSFKVLLWSAFLGTFTAIIMALSQKILTLNQAVNAWVGGVKALTLAALILVMAWSIGNVCNDVQTANWVIAVSKGLLSSHWIPTVTFIIAGLISFSTGSSWATMAILTPIVIPIAHHLPLADPAIDALHQQHIMLSSIAAVLAGSVFGDHCSPISDTTIMSSMASGSDHIDHVRTQMPYALTTAGVAVLFGFIPAGFGLSSGWEILAGSIVIYLILRYGGQKSTVNE